MYVRGRSIRFEIAWTNPLTRYAEIVHFELCISFTLLQVSDYMYDRLPVAAVDIGGRPNEPITDKPLAIDIPISNTSLTPIKCGLPMTDARARHTNCSGAAVACGRGRRRLTESEYESVRPLSTDS
ncbi:unnamed protein product [Phytophthora fragariaefolia]|uniref:Unnamed protein product n=1 Tax=Phytophthora fragariaefolia TaxID=1490495 RepID=A0A9W6Y671_9STRA|nr:unnamed protein product [Phytophthora fragariaefolia]